MVETMKQLRVGAFQNCCGREKSKDHTMRQEKAVNLVTIMTEGQRAGGKKKVNTHRAEFPDRHRNSQTDIRARPCKGCVFLFMLSQSYVLTSHPLSRLLQFGDTEMTGLFVPLSRASLREKRNNDCEQASLHI